MTDQHTYSGDIPYSGSMTSPAAFAVGDFNGDGTADVAIVGATSFGGYDVDVFLGGARKK
jgi:hypothetical protein